MTIRSHREQYRDSLRQEILDAARELFVRQGYEATSVRRIAEKVGCSPGILYHYFEDKPAIMAQLVREAFVRLTERLLAICNDTAPPADRLRRSLVTYVRFGLDHPHHYNVLFSPSHALGPKPDVILRAFMEDGMKAFGCLRQLVRECLEAGELRADLTDAEEVAQVLWTSIHGLTSAVNICEGFPFIEISRLIERQAEILLAGIQRES